jgi:hypothetical protein
LVILFVKENGRNSGVCMGFENGEEMGKIWVFRIVFAMILTPLPLAAQ